VNGDEINYLYQGYILIDRFLMEDYVGSISLHVIERIRFLPPLHFHIICIKPWLLCQALLAIVVCASMHYTVTIDDFVGNLILYCHVKNWFKFPIMQFYYQSFT